jgi:endonuclease-3
VRRIRDRLRAVYGIPRMAPHGDPIAELVLTVLSQSTNDRNRDVAFLRLRERFPRWEQVRDAPLVDVEEAIRPGGISKVKSARIQAILRAITADSPGGAPRRTPGAPGGARSPPPGAPGAGPGARGGAPGLPRSRSPGWRARPCSRHASI